MLISFVLNFSSSFGLIYGVSVDLHTLAGEIVKTGCETCEN